MSQTGKQKSSTVLSKQTKTKQKGKLPFNKQLMDLQKKIQEVEDKNDRILQQIHKAYNFKKKKIYYEAPEDQPQPYDDNYYEQHVAQHSQRPSITYRKYRPEQLNIRQSTRTMQHIKGPRYSGNSASQVQPPHSPYLSPPHQLQTRHISQQPQQHKIPLLFKQQNSQIIDDLDIQSNSNYSDVERRRQINQQVRKRQKDFSEIKSNIDDRRVPGENRFKQNHPIKKSYVFNDFENNSLYSEGNVPSKQKLQTDELEIVQMPVTSYPLISNRPTSTNYSYPDPISFISPRQKLNVSKALQSYPHRNFNTQNNIPVSPVTNPPYPNMRYSVYVKNPTYQQNQQQIPPTQLNFLKEMYLTEHQKVLSLEKQVDKKQEKISTMKKYKKNFKSYIHNSFVLFEDAFESFVEEFLKNRLYQMEKLVKKNQNRLARLLLVIKDLSDERQYNRSIKQLQNKQLYRRNYYSTDNTQQRYRRTTSPQQTNNIPENVFHVDAHNHSTYSTHSKDRSVSAKKRTSRDKSVTKKSNQSHLMKKEFQNIADKYEAMLKIKNQQIQKCQIEIRQNKVTIQALQQQNLKLKQSIPHSAGKIDTSLDQGKKQTGNLRILSRSSSRASLKKGSNPNILIEQNQQLSQKLKKFQKQIQTLSSQKLSLQEQLTQMKEENTKYSNQIRSANEKILNLQSLNKQPQTKSMKFLQQQKLSLKKSLQHSQHMNISLQQQLQSIKSLLTQKDKKISQLDSELYLKDNQIRKLENEIEIKNHKLQEFNKLLFSNGNKQKEKGEGDIGVGSGELNDSMLQGSVVEEQNNRSTLMVLQNLERQLEEEKHQKEVEFLKLKKSYDAKIEQLRKQFDDLVMENQKYQEKIKHNQLKDTQYQTEKQQYIQTIQQLKNKIEQLQRQITFLSDKVNYYETQRKVIQPFSQLKISDKGSGKKEASSGKKYEYMRPKTLEQHDLDDFPDELSNGNDDLRESQQSWKPAQGQVQLLDQSLTGTFGPVKHVSLVENNQQLTQQMSTSKNMHQNLSLLKNENLLLCQKVAKLEKENKFLQESEKEEASKIEALKTQLTTLLEKYNELQTYNQEIMKMLDQAEREKQDILNAQKQNQQNKHPFNLEHSIEPVELKGSVLGGAWNFLQKEDVFLDKSKDFDARQSINSNFTLPPHHTSPRQSMSKKIQQLTKKLSQTQLLLQNKQKLNQQLIIGFTKKIDQLQNQIQQQTKLIQKYINQNQKLRKQNQHLQQQLTHHKNLSIKQNSPQPKSQQQLLSKKFPSNQILHESQQHQQLSQNISSLKQHSQISEGDFLEQRIDPRHNDTIEEEPNESEERTTSKQKQVQEEKQGEQKKDQRAKRFTPMLEEEEGELEIEEFDERNERIAQLEHQVNELEETLQELTKEYERSLLKIKEKEEQKNEIVEELRKKNDEVEDLRDLIQLKDAKNQNNLYMSKSIIVHGQQKYELQKSQRNRMNSINSLMYSHRSNYGQKRMVSDDQIHFDFLDAVQNHSMAIDEPSHVSNIYSENMSMIFQKEQNFLDHIKKAKNKRKQQGRLLRKTFDYIKKLRTSINEKNKRIRRLELRLQQLKDNCWLWKKTEQPLSQINPGSYIMQPTSFISNPNPIIENSPVDRNNTSGIQVDQIDHYESFDDRNKLVDSRVFQCNSEDLNKKKPHRHNHYKKLQYDTKLIAQQNKILTKQIQMLQQQILKIQQQQNGLMAVKQIYKQQIRALTRQNQDLTNTFQQQIQKLQEKLQNSESIHNFEAIKQLFEKIVGCFGVILNPGDGGGKKKIMANVNQLKEEKRKEAEEYVKVMCSILDYDEAVKNQLCSKLVPVAST